VDARAARSDAGTAHLARLGSVSRPTGGAAIAAARAYCADELESLGFAVTEQSFEYSKFAGAWSAPAFGFLLPALATALVYALPFTRLLEWLVAFAIIGAISVLRFPLLRAQGVNLEATRGDPTSVPPTVWLVAHLDSKWQPVSMFVRVAGVITMAIGLIGVIVGSQLSPTLEVALLILAWVGGVPLICSVVGARNHGTLDNASGVATILEAAERLHVGANVGVLITDAEELALAGARAWARTRSAGVALNCDSVDDDGPLVVMYSRSRPRRLISAVARAALDQKEPVRVLRLIPGILTDHVALAGAGWETLTLSRGTARTLQRIHTTRDTLASMNGVGISGAARVLAQTASDLAHRAYEGERGGSS
jgi:hypothetical protein